MKKTLFALLICSTLAVALPSLSVSSLAAPAEPVADTSIETQLMYWHANPLQNGAIK